MAMQPPRMPARGEDILDWARNVTAYLRRLTPTGSDDILPKSDTKGTTFLIRQKPGGEGPAAAGEQGVIVESLGTGEPVLVDSLGEKVDTVQGYSLRSTDEDRLLIEFNPETDEVEFSVLAVGEIDVNLVGPDPDDSAYILLDPGDVGYDDEYSQHRSITGRHALTATQRANDILLQIAASSVGGGGVDIYDGQSDEEGLRIRSIEDSGTKGIEVNLLGEDVIEFGVIATNIGGEVEVFRGLDSTDGLQFRTLIGDGKYGLQVEEATGPGALDSQVRFKVVASNFRIGADGLDIYRDTHDTFGLRFRSIDDRARKGVAAVLDGSDELIELQFMGANVAGGVGLYKGLDEDEGAQFHALADDATHSIAVGLGVDDLVHLEWFYANTSEGTGYINLITEIDAENGATFRALKEEGGSGINFALSGDEIIGEFVAVNVGGEKEVFKDIDATEGVRFRTLKAGSGITLTQNANDIEIEADGGIPEELWTTVTLNIDGSCVTRQIPVRTVPDP